MPIDTNSLRPRFPALQHADDEKPRVALDNPGGAQPPQRVPTVSFTMDGRTPRAIAEALARENIFVSASHYNTTGALDRLLEIVAGAR
ncbi:MAG: hypothetical protein ACE5FI_13895 [Anaerolineales bacterium]